ncbi:MAG: tRNA (guanosine(37)-N1)-methyltransferase TrmD [Rhizobiales bacterium]|nr:tRNA (guanosine(37)-N1)-methyltransferase TrmD [Hyphomicrobiales bacterium]NRB14617.1 tRNA (guanosine(37)-N1)-methyltransferase TrmD [Hyphomicrobiales bacterium]
MRQNNNQTTTQNTWRASVMTLYPEMFPGSLGMSIAGRALAAGTWSCETTQIRDFGTGKHKNVDDTPTGGGAGMVLRPDVLSQCIKATRLAGDVRPLIYLSPRGKPLTQQKVRELAQGDGVILLCGRFEGVDQRLLDAEDIEEISLGDYILSGGEVAALTLLDACVRLLPEVMGSEHSGDDESFENGLLEYPHYTKPREWQGQVAPDVLRSGDHGKIAKWRHEQAVKTTQKRRPDLWQAYRDDEN